MPQYVAQAFFASDDGGWSESYYMLSPVLATAQGQFGQIMSYRLGLLCGDNDLVYSRLSDVAIRGDAIPSGVAPAGGTYSVSTVKSQSGYAALLYQEQATAAHRASRWIRQLPSDCFANGDWSPTTLFISTFASFRTTVLADTVMRSQIVPHTVPATYNYLALTDLIFRYLGSRRLGRPFGSPRGRRLIR